MEGTGAYLGGAERQRVMCRVIVCVAVAMLMGGIPRAVGAQAAPAQIEVRVVDANGKPLADARIFVSGAAMTSALTPRDGTIRFDDVEPGVYALRAERSGYDTVEIGEVEALAGRRKFVDVTLLRSVPHAMSGDRVSRDLKTIGSVRSRAPVSISSVDVDEGDPIRRVSENLADALNKLAGVQVDTSASSGTLTISLRNADPSSTLATAGGVPLLGGGAPQLQQVAADLSTGVGVDAANQAGGLGGAVNFRTLEPTRTWQGQFSSSYGSYDQRFASLSLSGSEKKLGIAVQHATRSQDSVLTGQTFADASGETYDHDGSSSRSGDFVKLRYSVSPKLTVNASMLAGAYDTSLVCDQFVTNLPCGFGPGNTSNGWSGTTSLGVQAQLGHVTFFSGAYTNAYTYAANDEQLIVSGVPEPYRSEGDGGGRGLYEYASIAIARHTISLGTSTFGGTMSARSFGAFQTPTTSAMRFGALSLSDQDKFSDRWSASASIGTNTSTTGTTGQFGAALTLQPSRFQTLSAQLNVGGSGASFFAEGPFGDPAQAQYNCTGDSVRTSGPNEAPVPSSMLDTELTYDARGRHGTLRVNAYDRVQRGALLSAQFPLLALGSAIPAGYLDAIEQIWQQPAICGERAFDPSRVFVAETIAGPDVRYRGVDASGQLVLGRAVIAQASYSLDEAILASNDPLLSIEGSPYALGAQLPFRPLHRAGLTLDALQRNASLEWLANGQWTSANNSNALSSYIVVAAGVSWVAPRGRLTLLATNLFQADTGKFATAEFAQPIALNGGGVYLPVPTLLAPRTYTLLYSIRGGRQR
jgi:hypothetical protein